MTIQTILSPGTTEATSSDVTITGNSRATIGLYSPNEQGLPERATATIFQVTPGAAVKVAVLDHLSPVRVFEGPATFRVVRQAGFNVGIFDDV